MGVIEAIIRDITTAQDEKIEKLNAPSPTSNAKPSLIREIFSYIS
jgi:hypothetical protein